MYERFFEELKTYSKAIRILSKGYLPIYLLPPSKLEKILKEVRKAITKSNKDYDLVLTRLYLYYDMKLVTFGIDKKRNLIIQFPVFVQPYTQNRLIMCQIETVPVPILDQNEKAQSYTPLKIDKLYIALDAEMYITLRTEELHTCKKIGYEYFCEELFVVKSKTRYSCTSAIYFNLDPQTIKENCEFKFYFNKTDEKPAVLDGRPQIIFANWPSYKKIMCVRNNNIPINIPSHPYVLLNRSILCNCDLEAESNFLLESLAACKNFETKTDLVMYFTVNLAFVNYLKDAVESLPSSVSTNWTTQGQILPIAIEDFEFNPKLLTAPMNMKDFLAQYKYRKEITEKQNKKEIEETKISSKFGSFLDSCMVDMLLFTVALITIVVTLVVMYMVCGQSKLKALVANIALQHTKAAEAADSPTRYCIREPNWYIVGLLLIMLVGITYLVMCKFRKSSLFKGYLFSNVTKIVLFISNATTYVPIKLNRIVGSIHLFKLRGTLTIEHVRFKRNWIWDVLEIDWRDIGMTINGNAINLPKRNWIWDVLEMDWRDLVVIPLRDKFRARKLLRRQPLFFHVMLKQGKTWFTVDHNDRNPVLLTPMPKNY